MLTKLNTFSLLGATAHFVDVEVSFTPAPPPPEGELDGANANKDDSKTTIVGLAETVVRESAFRVRLAVNNSGYRVPRGYTVVNLAPADLPKQAASFDLPISIGLIAAWCLQEFRLLDQYAVVGELALDGRTRPCRGVLAFARAAKAQGLRGIVVPAANAREAALVEGIEAIPVASLNEAVGFLTGDLPIAPERGLTGDEFDRLARYDVDFDEVRGQEIAKRAMTIAAAGGHNLLMIGSPGAGKTMLAKRLPTILPPLTLDEALETTELYSAVGKLGDRPIIAKRPFREPHHSISEPGLIGGGARPMPGELSLAHNGVLFLDELPEFNRKALEALRQPLEDGRAVITRSNQTEVFPAKIILVVAMNPCPCGFRLDPKKKCRCSSQQVEKYLARVSGPLLDRIDLHIETTPVSYKELSTTAPQTSSAEMRERVLRAREIQARRYEGESIRANSEMRRRHLDRWAVLKSDASDMLEEAMDKHGFSARAHDKSLRVARTIADIEGREQIETPDVFEALSYRALDRKLWA